MKAELSPDDVKRISRGLVNAILEENRESLSLLSPAQVCGLLDVSLKTLADLSIPRVTIVPGKIYRYRLADVKAWLESNRA